MQLNNKSHLGSKKEKKKKHHIVDLRNATGLIVVAVVGVVVAVVVATLPVVPSTLTFAGLKPFWMLFTVRSWRLRADDDEPFHFWRIVKEKNYDINWIETINE